MSALYRRLSQRRIPDARTCCRCSCVLVVVAGNLPSTSVFSNEHEIVDRNSRLVDIGSWRGAAGFLADQLNRQTGSSQYDYMDFYMGSFWRSQRADLTPVYEMIFHRLKELS